MHFATAAGGLRRWLRIPVYREGVDVRVTMGRVWRAATVKNRSRA